MTFIIKVTNQKFNQTFIIKVTNQKFNKVTNQRRQSSRWHNSSAKNVVNENSKQQPCQLHRRVAKKHLGKGDR
jgi:hypothetical protein